MFEVMFAPPRPRKFPAGTHDCEILKYSKICKNINYYG